MKKNILLLALLAVAAFVISTIYPPAYADSAAGTTATVHGGKTVILGELPVVSESSTKVVNHIETQQSATVPVVANNYTDDSGVLREMRGAWIATVKNINMPAGMNEAAFTKWADENIAYLKSNNFNAVIFQVRPTGDALYKSAYAPWSSFVTGKAQGTDPGYDPLAIMVSKAHEAGIELHAWINPYRVTMPSDTLDGLSASNIAKINPNWLVSYGGQYYLNPGIAEVRTHLVNVVSEIVDNYDVDAIHIDDYFYPYPISGAVYNDDLQFATYGKNYTNKDDWRRDNVTKLVSDLYNAVKTRKSYVQLGISPFGVWRNKTSDITGSDTNAGHECYDGLYADTRRWINEGIIDYIAPQIYWSTKFSAANYNTLAAWWNNEVETQAKTRPVNLYVGMANYKINNNADEQWNNPNEILNQIDTNRLSPNISGQMHYSFASLKENKLNHVNLIKDSKYNSIALTPTVPGSSPRTCFPPTSLTTAKDANAVHLTIGSGDVNTRKFIIYRFDGASLSQFKAEDVIGVVYKNAGGSTVFSDTTAIAGKTYTYMVKAISDYGIINQTAKTVVITK